ncbi:MAG: glycerol-3-phosphate 1-O-acyltransferase PlsY [Candidatus Acidiferrales bacterium]
MNQEMGIGAPILFGLVLAGYLLGSIPFGYLLVRLRSGGDIRAMGSGNIGATNVARSAGWAVGVATLLLDATKGFLAVWLAGHFSDGNIRIMMYAGLAAILGHVFPVWLRFAGGKGVATALGVFLANCWPAAVAAVAVFLVVAVFWRYVSLASVSAAAALPVLFYVLYAPGHAPPYALSACTVLAAAIVIIKHRDNIERLMTGTEPRFEMGRKKQ